MEPTGNVPFAPASLAAAAGLPRDSVLPQDLSDSLGDRALLRMILDRRPPLVAFTLYSWNSQRSASLAREIRQAAPKTILVGGGPEVYSDNCWLVSEGAFDLLVSGEGESLAETALDPKSAASLAGNGRLVVAETSKSPPGSWPNPYLSGYIEAGAGDSIYLETVRGCSSGCVFCSYRRSHPLPRVEPAESVLHTLGRLPSGEVTFLDPTFNSRPDLPRLLSGLKESGRRLFGEVRGEPIDKSTALAMADAGFASVEVGLQSTSPQVCRRCGRGGDPAAAMRGARLLLEAGVVPVMDLIMGLPGDEPSLAIRSAAELCDRGLSSEVQVFPLAVLPGTEVRRCADRLGIRHMEQPPYLVLSTPGYPSPRELAETREQVADLLGYDLQVDTRPVLTEEWVGSESFSADEPPPAAPPPSRRHGRLVIRGRNLWACRDNVLAHVRRRIRWDPWCVLDVVLAPDRPFPLDLLDLLRDTEEIYDYTNAMARYLGTRGRLRLSVLAEGRSGRSLDWLAEAAQQVPAVADLESPENLPGGLWKAGVGVRLPGRWEAQELSRRVLFPGQVYFRRIDMETVWSQRVLGLL